VPDDDGPTASVGFASIRWRGKLYWFTAEQRLIVAHLWEAMEAGEPFVMAGTLLAVADVRAERVRDAFRGSDAWESVIVPGPVRGGPVGTLCLAWAKRGQ
jgi:hypothetical protein